MTVLSSNLSMMPALTRHHQKRQSSKKRRTDPVGVEILERGLDLLPAVLDDDLGHHHHELCKVDGAGLVHVDRADHGRDQLGRGGVPELVHDVREFIGRDLAVRVFCVFEKTKKKKHENYLLTGRVGKWERNGLLS